MTLFFYLFFHKNYRIYLSCLFKKSPILYLKELLAIGLPIGGMFAIEIGFFFVLALIMGQFGSVFIAANQLTMQFLGFLTSISFAISVAISVRMGHMLGAGDLPAAKRALSAGTLFASSVMVIVAFFYWFFPSYLLGIDINLANSLNKELFNITSGFLVFSAIFQIVESIRISFYGGLRALKDTHFTFITSIIGFWCIPLLLGWFLVKFCQWQPHAYWFAMIIGASCSVLLLAARLKKKVYELKHVKIS